MGDFEYSELEIYEGNGRDAAADFPQKNIKLQVVRMG